MKDNPNSSYSSLGRARRQVGLTQQQLADAAGISVQYVRSIEGGYKDVSDEIKEKLATALNWSAWALFPDLRRRVNLFEVLRLRFGDELVIRPREEAMFKEVLSRVNEDQFEELLTSGTTEAEVHRLIRKWAKDLNIEVIK